MMTLQVLTAKSGVDRPISTKVTIRGVWFGEKQYKGNILLELIAEAPETDFAVSLRVKDYETYLTKVNRIQIDISSNIEIQHVAQALREMAKNLEGLDKTAAERSLEQNKDKEAP